MRRYSTFIAVFAVLFVANSAFAERIGFRFMRVNASGLMKPVIAGPNGALGWRAAWAGGVRSGISDQPRPTHTMTLRHSYTRCCVRVPLQLPQGTPKIEIVLDQIVYNYGTYTVTIRFLEDGTVETIYNSGLFRALSLVN